MDLRIPADGETTTAARSHNKEDLLLQRIGTGKLRVLLLGGVHGDESEGFLLVERLAESLKSGETRLPHGIELYICPRVNPDGCAALRRTNHRNVDLNRNLPTKDWSADFSNVRYYPGENLSSELESKFTTSLINQLDVHVIFSMHSYEHAMINFNGDCEDLAIAMEKQNGLVPKGDIGYHTPGSLGTYAGWERGIPTITLEIFRGSAPDDVWNGQKDALISGISFYLEHPLPARTKV